MEVGAAANVEGDDHVVVHVHHDPPPDNSDHGYYHDLVNLPPGFRFHPTDEEIISHYLTFKVIDAGFITSAIGEVDLNKCEPWDLPKKAKMGEKEWFFFCQRDRKYPTGMRTNRATDSGYWKATGKDKEIYKHGKGGPLVGMKKTLVFYKGRAPKGEKTNWVMHEFRLEGNFSYYNFPMSSKDEWVVCKVFHKSSTTIGIRRSPQRDDNPHVMSRLNSFVDDLLDSPSSLMPPLVDAPPDYDHHHDVPAASRLTNNISGKDDDDEQPEKKGKFKGAITALSTMNSNSDAGNSHLPYYNSSNIRLKNVVNDHHNQLDYKTLMMPPYNYNFNTNSFQANPAMLSSQTVHYPNSPNKQLSLYSQISSQKLPQLAIMDRGCKLEQYLASPSSRTNLSTSCMISHSQDTGLSTADMNAEISSSMVSKQDTTSSKSNYDALGHDDHFLGPLVDHDPDPLSEFDSFWEY